MTYRANINDTALDIAKALLTAADMRELKEEADEQEIEYVEAVASVSFDMAEAFHAEAERRAGR